MCLYESKRVCKAGKTTAERYLSSKRRITIYTRFVKKILGFAVECMAINCLRLVYVYVLRLCFVLYFYLRFSLCRLISNLYWYGQFATNRMYNFGVRHYPVKSSAINALS